MNVEDIRKEQYYMGKWSVKEQILYGENVVKQLFYNPLLSELILSTWKFSSEKHATQFKFLLQLTPGNFFENGRIQMYNREVLTKRQQ